MKTLFCTLLLVSLSALAANADTVTITFDQPDQSAGPGDTLEFFGTITNDTGNTVYLNTDDLNLIDVSLTTNDQFFNTVPISLAAGASSGDIELFDVSVSSPLLDATGTFSGTYTLFGGVDGDASDNLGQASFSVTTTPEPSSIFVLLGLSGAVVLISRKIRRAV
jgi:hypothetical protein